MLDDKNPEVSDAEDMIANQQPSVVPYPTADLIKKTGHGVELWYNGTTVNELYRAYELAVAHDRQPCPTADAYERVCAALAKSKENAEALATKLEGNVDITRNLLLECMGYMSGLLSDSIIPMEKRWQLSEEYVDSAMRRMFSSKPTWNEVVDNKTTSAADRLTTKPNFVSDENTAIRLAEQIWKTSKSEKTSMPTNESSCAQTVIIIATLMYNAIQSIGESAGGYVLVNTERSGHYGNAIGTLLLYNLVQPNKKSNSRSTEHVTEYILTPLGMLFAKNLDQRNKTELAMQVDSSDTKNWSETAESLVETIWSMCSMSKSNDIHDRSFALSIVNIAIMMRAEELGSFLLDTCSQHTSAIGWMQRKYLVQPNRGIDSRSTPETEQYILTPLGVEFANILAKRRGL